MKWPLVHPSQDLIIRILRWIAIHFNMYSSIFTSFMDGNHFWCVYYYFFMGNRKILFSRKTWPNQFHWHSFLKWLNSRLTGDWATWPMGFCSQKPSPRKMVPPLYWFILKVDRQCWSKKNKTPEKRKTLIALNAKRVKKDYLKTAINSNVSKNDSNSLQSWRRSTQAIISDSQLIFFTLVPEAAGANRKPRECSSINFSLHCTACMRARG